MLLTVAVLWCLLREVCLVSMVSLLRLLHLL
jgi:hypothetical protein